MDKFEQKINREKALQHAVPSAVLAIQDTMPGVTDALFINNVLDELGESYPLYTADLERNETAMVPTVSAILEKLGYKDDKGAKDGKGKYGWQKFVENFGKDINGRPGREKGNKDRILGTPELGERGWETIKKLWQQASHDAMMQDIKDKRIEALNGGAGMRVPLVGTEIPVSVSRLIGAPVEVAGNIFTPRYRAALEEGRDPGLLSKEFGMDLAQNLAYAAPIGGVEAGIARTLGGSQAAKALGTIVANSIAPTAITLGDAATGAKDYAGGADMALDALVGSATNLGVNRVLAPLASQVLSAGAARAPKLKMVSDFLEGIKTDNQKALDVIREAETKVAKHFKETNSEYLNKLRNGRPVDRLSDEELRDYIDILRTRDAIKENEVGGKLKEALAEIREQDDFMRSMGEKAGQFNLEGDPTIAMPNWSGMQEGKKSVRDILDMALPEQVNPSQGNFFTQDNENLAANLLLGKASKGEPLELSMREFLDTYGGPRRDAMIRAMEKHPELLSQFDRPTFKEVLAMPRTGVDVGKSWVVNRVGDDAAAQRFLSRFGVDVDDIRKEQDEARRNNRVASDILDIERSYETDARDRKFLEDIAKNPDIMTLGHPTDPEGFKLWLLERGHDMLSGTSAARPAWEIK